MYTVKSPIKLVAPDPSRFKAWASAVEEFNQGAMDGFGYLPEEIKNLVPTEEAFATYLQRAKDMEDPNAPRPEGWVLASKRWIVDASWEDGGPLLGFISARHALTEYLLNFAGHICYSVRPSARRQGVATAALVQMLEIAKELGAYPTLVTCATENKASTRTIERAGGKYEDTRENTKRFWFGEQPWPQTPTA